MSCRRGQDDWHSYVRQSLNELELQEMTSHLGLCRACRQVVAEIQSTAALLAGSRAELNPPAAIKLSVMAAIDKNKYAKMDFPYFFARRNWGLSMVAAGLILFAVNLTSWVPDLQTGPGFNSKLNRQLTQPFELMSLATQAALGKIEIIYEIPGKIEQVIKKEASR